MGIKPIYHSTMTRDVEFDHAGRGPALDLAATVILVGGRAVDLLRSAADLGRWLELEEPWVGPAGPDTPLRLADFRSLRDAIRTLFAAAVTRTPMPAGAVEGVNAASAAVALAPALDATDPRFPRAIQVGAAGSRTAGILGAIARSAIDIVGGPDRDRLRVCGAPRCGRAYLAGRPRQTWCSASCGNRARVARHHERRRVVRSVSSGP